MTDPDQGRVTVGVPRESLPGEGRVALTPQAAGKLVADGARVLVERGAGESAFHPDAEYADAGAEPIEAGALYAAADVIVRVSPPSDEEADRLTRGCLLVGQLAPLNRPELVSRLAAAGVSALAMELIPRITRAQAMDALSSQASVAGYRSALIAAEHLPRFFPLMMTAAGTVAPAKVLVLGAGVAGLQAIATARRLGAVVSAFDVRPAAREQVESLGARFLEVELPETGEGEGGYARELSEETRRLQQELTATHVADSDVVISTALVPGRPAPRLVTAAMVESMRPGSVIVDLAADAGGNCELTEPGETVVRHAVTLVGTRNPAAEMPQHASQLYARNVSALLALLLRDGRVELDLSDEIVSDALVCQAGEIRNETIKALLEERTA